jgi:transposase
MIWHEANYDGLVQLRYSFRLYPTPGQCIALAKAFGCARVVFNDALAARQAAYVAGLPYVTDAALSARLTAAKATPERAWLSEVSAVVLQQAQADLNAAYRNFFASRTGARKGPKISLPRFRSRKDRRQTIRFTRNARFAVTPGGKLRLPKVGDVPVVWSRTLPSEPSSVTVIRDSAGRYFASFVIETEPARLPECPACETWLDRDINAAVNVARAAGLAVTACGAQVRPGAPPLAQRSEAGTLRGAA